MHTLRCMALGTSLSWLRPFVSWLLAVFVSDVQIKLLLDMKPLESIVLKMGLHSLEVSITVTSAGETHTRAVGDCREPIALRFRV